MPTNLGFDLPAFCTIRAAIRIRQLDTMLERLRNAPLPERTALAQACLELLSQLERATAELEHVIVMRKPNRKWCAEARHIVSQCARDAFFKNSNTTADSQSRYQGQLMKSQEALRKLGAKYFECLKGPGNSPILQEVYGVAWKLIPLLNNWDPFPDHLAGLTRDETGRLKERCEEEFSDNDVLWYDDTLHGVGVGLDKLLLPEEETGHVRYLRLYPKWQYLEAGLQTIEQSVSANVGAMLRHTVSRERESLPAGPTKSSAQPLILGKRTGVGIGIEFPTSSREDMKYWLIEDCPIKGDLVPKEKWHRLELSSERAKAVFKCLAESEDGRTVDEACYLELVTKLGIGARSASARKDRSTQCDEEPKGRSVEEPPAGTNEETEANEELKPPEGGKPTPEARKTLHLADNLSAKVPGKRKRSRFEVAIHDLAEDYRTKVSSITEVLKPSGRREQIFKKMRGNRNVYVANCFTVRYLIPADGGFHFGDPGLLNVRKARRRD